MAYYAIYKEKKIALVKLYIENNIDKVKERRKSYVPDKERKRIVHNEWRQKNKDILNKKQREYHKRRLFDDEYRAKVNLRKLIYRLQVEKKGKTFQLLGYTIDEFKSKVGLCNANESIDHKIPMSWFLKDTPANIVHHLDNLQILSRSDNSKKNNKFCDTVPKTYYLICKQYIKQNKVKSLKYE